jgi:hypothetical protein
MGRTLWAPMKSPDVVIATYRIVHTLVHVIEKIVIGFRNVRGYKNNVVRNLANQLQTTKFVREL